MSCKAIFVVKLSMPYRLYTIFPIDDKYSDGKYHIGFDSRLLIGINFFCFDTIENWKKINQCLMEDELTWEIASHLGRVATNK